MSVKKEIIEYLSAEVLTPFKDHPFYIREGVEKEQLIL